MHGQGAIRRIVVRLVAVALIAGLAPSLAMAAEDRPGPSAGLLALVRADAVSWWLGGGSEVRRLAGKAMADGGADALVKFAEGVGAARERDDRARVEKLVVVGGPGVRKGAQEALAGDGAKVREFLASGWQVADRHDDRIRVGELAESGGPGTVAAAEEALRAGKAEAVEEFLGRVKELTAHDDRIRVGQLGDAGGPGVSKAADQVLIAGPDAVRDFLEYGWQVAAWRDTELPSVRQLAAEAQTARQTAASESAEAVRTAEAAKEAARLAKEAMDRAEQEMKAAADDRVRAAVALGRAADAAEDAGRASRAAVGAASRAAAAARTAIGAASRAAAVASQAARAAAAARQAALAARSDRNLAGEAKRSAEEASRAAVAAKLANETAEHAGQASLEAGRAAAAASDAGKHAGEAADAADRAARNAKQAGVEHGRAKRAARQARVAAGQATAQAGLAARLAAESRVAANEARAAAESAERHADEAAKAWQEAERQKNIAEWLAGKTREHAAAAARAADQARDAADKAEEIAKQARRVEADFLAEVTKNRTKQAVDEAEDEAETRAAGRDGLRWGRDLRPEYSRWDPATQELAKSVLKAVLTGKGDKTERVKRAREMAVRLLSEGGPNTAAVAQDALSGTDEDLFAAMTAAVWQAGVADNQDRVAVIAAEGDEYASDQAALKKAAAALVTETDSGKLTKFLETRDYPERGHADRIRIGQIEDKAGNDGDTTLVEAARAALTSKAPDAKQKFLIEGQVTAQRHDNRIRAGKIADVAAEATQRAAAAAAMPDSEKTGADLQDELGGQPELAAAAETALVAPPGDLAKFLAVGQYQARQHDAETATHIAAVRHYVNVARTAANHAAHEASVAADAAIGAGAAAEEAKGYVGKAKEFLDTATKLAQQAHADATTASTHADQAESDAKTARKAAGRANADLNKAIKAERSAAASHARAVDSSQQARGWANQAYSDAVAAGKDRDAAQASAATAWRSYWDKYHQEEEAKRRAEQQAAGQQAEQDARDPNKIVEALSPETEQKLRAACDDPANNGQQCVDQWNKHLEAVNNSGGDVAAAVADGVISLIPIVGSVKTCIEESTGNCLISIISEIPVFKWFKGGKKAAKAADEIGQIIARRAGSNKEIGRLRALMERGGKKADEPHVPNPVCPRSFPPGTPVLLAGGTHKPIEQLRAGDHILATNPHTGVTAPQPVTQTHTTTGLKQMVTLTIDTDGPAGDATGILTATTNHLVWNTDTNTWTEAGNFTQGTHLRTPNGSSVTVIATRQHIQQQTVHNLTIDNTPTYYVAAANADVLVHNTGPCPPVSWITGKLPAAEEAALNDTLRHIDAGTVPQGPTSTKWGTKHKNNEGNLPGPAGGNSPYLEYRVAPPPGMSGAGTLRVVRNKDTGETYYTWTHYGKTGTPAFVRIR